MSRLLRISLLANLLLAVGLATVAVREDYHRKLAARLFGATSPAGDATHYRHRLFLQRRLIEQALEGAPLDIVFIGDSIIERWLTSARVDRSLNLGISGDTLSGVARRLDADLLEAAPVWYLGAGINDVLRGVPASRQQEGIDRITSALAGVERLIWRAALPVGGAGWSAADEEARQVLNRRFEIACAGLPNCRFLEAPTGYGSELASLTEDGLHPNAAGYRLLTTQLCGLEKVRCSH
jgi:hypothetical protein